MQTPYYLLGILSDARAYGSRSPLMHRAALRAAGLTGDYVPLQVNPGRLGEALQGLWALGFQGANITVPYKESLMERLVALSPEAESIGAVNTLVRQAEGFSGHNTDAEGFRLAAAPWGGFQEGRVLVAGYGGAARAVLATLNQGGAEVTLAGRSAAKAARLAEAFGVNYLDSLPPGYECDWLINASAVSDPREGPELAAWAAGLTVKQGLMDLNYGRARNFWAEAAAARRILFKDGLDMLAYQAWASFKLWTGADPGVEIFKNALSRS